MLPNKFYHVKSRNRALFLGRLQASVDQIGYIFEVGYRDRGFADTRVVLWNEFQEAIPYFDEQEDDNGCV